MALNGWFLNLTGTGNILVYSVAVGSDGSIYFCGLDGGAGPILGKLTSAGAVSWTKKVNPAAGGTGGAAVSIAVDGSDNAYVLSYGVSGSSSFCSGSFSSFSINYNEFYVTKYNSSGTSQWIKSFNNLAFSNGDNLGNSIRATSAGDIYVCGVSNVSDCFSSTGYPILLKLNSSGAIQYLRLGNNPGVDWSGQGLHSLSVDASANAYFLDGTAPSKLIKYDSTGVLVWEKSVNEFNTQNMVQQGTGIDSGGNIIITGNETAKIIGVVKFNSSGAIVWSKKITATAANMIAESVSVDASDNIYITILYSSTPNNILLVKLDSSGNLLFSYNISKSNHITPYSCCKSANGIANHIIIGGYESSTPATGIIMAVPSDAVYAGTYSGWTITAGTITVGAATYTLSTPTGTMASDGVPAGTNGTPGTYSLSSTSLSLGP